MLGEFAKRGPLRKRLCGPGERQFPDDAVGHRMLRPEESVPAELFQNGAESLADADRDQLLGLGLQRVDSGALPLARYGSPVLLDQVGVVLGLEQARPTLVLLLEKLIDGLRMAHEQSELLLARGRADMLGDALTGAGPCRGRTRRSGP